MPKWMKKPDTPGIWILVTDDKIYATRLESLHIACFAWKKVEGAYGPVPEIPLTLATGKPAISGSLSDLISESLDEDEGAGED